MLEVECQAIGASGQHRVEHDVVERRSQAEHVRDHLVDPDAGPARIRAPAASDSHAPGPDAAELAARLAAVHERGIGAAEVRVALARESRGHVTARQDRADRQQALERLVGPADPGHRLDVANVGMDVLEPDLPPEARRRLGALEVARGPTAVMHRPVHQPHAVREGKAALDDRDVPPCLLDAEHPADDPPRHRQQPIRHAGLAIARVEKVLDTVGPEIGQAGDHAARHEVAIEVGPHPPTDAGKPIHHGAPPRPSADRPIPIERLVGELDGPGADQPPGHRRVGRLERVFPVATGEDRERRAGDAVVLDSGDLPIHVCEDRIGLARHRLRLAIGPCDALIEDREVAGRLHVVAQGLDRPEDDVGVAVGRPHLSVPVEHEPLRPVAGVRILVLVDEPEQIAQRSQVPRRDEKLDGALADVAQAHRRPARLLEPVRGRVVDHRVVDVPAQHVVEAGQVVGTLPGRAPEHRPPPHRGPRVGRREFRVRVGIHRAAILGRQLLGPSGAHDAAREHERRVRDRLRLHDHV